MASSSTSSTASPATTTSWTSRRWETLAARIPGFSYTTVVADPASAHPRKGYVTDHLAAEQLNAGEIDVYLCGPPPMVDAVRGWLAAQGMTPAGFHTEKFAASGAAAQPLKLAS